MQSAQFPTLTPSCRSNIEEPIKQRLDELAECLRLGQPIWRANPFYQVEPDWIEDYPTLAEFLTGLATSEVAAFHMDPNLLYRQLRVFVPSAQRIEAICRVPPVHHSVEQPPRGFDGIPGRKWHQITAFANVIGPLSMPVVEWCAGKGYLGRWLNHQSSVPIISLDWDPDLCDKGMKQAQATAILQKFHCVNVLSGDINLDADHHVVALHACGDLHRQMLLKSVESQVARISLSPCCYHLTKNERYYPLSLHGQQLQLSLACADLRLAVQDNIISSSRHRRLRNIEMTYRLGYQELLLDHLPTLAMAGVPVVAKSKLSNGFEWFCRWAAYVKGYRLPDAIDWKLYLDRGEARWFKAQRYDLANHLFRRVMELLVVLDSAQYLFEAGYKVRLVEFTSRQITPRNLLIDAWRK